MDLKSIFFLNKTEIWNLLNRIEFLRHFKDYNYKIIIYKIHNNPFELLI